MPPDHALEWRYANALTTCRFPRSKQARIREATDAAANATERNRLSTKMAAAASSDHQHALIDAALAKVKKGKKVGPLVNPGTYGALGLAHPLSLSPPPLPLSLSPNTGISLTLALALAAPPPSPTSSPCSHAHCRRGQPEIAISHAG